MTTPSYPTYVITQEPGQVPRRKGPFFGNKMVEGFLRDAYRYSPDMICIVIDMENEDNTWYPEHGYEWLDINGDRRRRHPRKEQKTADAVALDAVDKIFKDLRGRRFLKWIFDERGEECWIGRFDDGDLLTGLDLEVQSQIKAKWQVLIAKAIGRKLDPSPQTTPPMQMVGPVWHQVDGRGWEWDVWKGKDLVALIRFANDGFMVIRNGRCEKEFSDLGDCIAWVCLQLSEGDATPSPQTREPAPASSKEVSHD